MKIASELKIIGKIVTMDDGSQLMFTSGGMEYIGSGCTSVFRRGCETDKWENLSMKEALPFVALVAKSVLDRMEAGEL